jgi:hypothetical protein
MLQWLKKTQNPEKTNPPVIPTTPQSRECEVILEFQVPTAKQKHIHRALSELNKAGVSFDTKDNLWLLDYSLKGAKIISEIPK